MSRAFGVVGANYGDEGKGRSVDALVRALGAGNMIVVRSNGGAQAGHTVVDEIGRRHVFHHIGSGSMAGAPTHLSQFFVHHPITFLDEIAELARIGVFPKVSADPRGFVTTPWDMMVNQAVETARGSARHGSCGYGFGETVGRNEETGFGLTFENLSEPDLKERLISIRDQWLPQRLAVLGIAADDMTIAAIANEKILENFMLDCAEFVSMIDMVRDADIGSYSSIVFEAAQGLLLDQRGDDFPYVTRSNTGVENMAVIAREAGIDAIDVVYATRSYFTRHGAGPMSDERALDGLFDVIDMTNVPNPWQHTLRTGLLDIDALAERIRFDVSKAGDVLINRHLLISCMDQVIGDVSFIKDDKVCKADADSFIDLTKKTVGAVYVSTAWGPAAAQLDISMIVQPPVRIAA